MSGFWRKDVPSVLSGSLPGLRQAAAALVVSLAFGITASYLVRPPGELHRFTFGITAPRPKTGGSVPLALPGAFTSRAGPHLAQEVEVEFTRIVEAPERLAILALIGMIATAVGVASVALTRRSRVGVPCAGKASLRHPGLPTSTATRDARYKACFAQSADGMLLVRVEPDGRFLYEDMNEAWQDLSAQPAERGIGTHPEDARPTVVDDVILERFQRCVATGQPIHYEWEGVGLGGRNLQIVIHPVRETSGNRRGQIMMLVCHARDVTEQRQLDERKLHERQMQTIRRLSAGVAHDFNNILQGVCGALELILDETDSDSVRDLADIAIGSAQRGSLLTQHLLSYSRRQVLSPRPIVLKQFLIETRPLLEQAIGPRSRMKFAFGKGDATVFADENHLRMALVLLAVNGAQAMPDGGLLQIACDDVDDCGGRLRICVTDAGSGMDPPTLARCVEPFFTTKGATATGLGLSMVEGFAIQSGGSLRLFSHSDRGTTVALTLPTSDISMVVA